MNPRARPLMLAVVVTPHYTGALMYCNGPVMDGT
jgi:hypothetical protein